MTYGFRRRYGRGVLCKKESLSEAADALMVRAVYRQGAAVNLIQESAGDNGGVVRLVAILILVAFILFHMLYDGSAEKYIYNLHPLTDAENRFFVAQGLFQGLELNNIQFGINVSGAIVFLPEKCRCDIPAAGQDKAVAGVDFAEGKRGLAGNAKPV